MTFEEAKKTLEDYFLNLGFSLNDDESDNKYLVRHGASFVLDDRAIGAYANAIARRNTFEQKPNACSFCSLNYREQAIEDLNVRRLPFMPRRGNEYAYGFGQVNTDDQIFATVGEASDLYVFYLLEDEGFVDFTNRFRRPFRIEEHTPLFASFRRPVTIKVHNLSATSISNAVEKSDKIINNCLFELSYLKNRPFGIMETWPSLNRERPLYARLSENYRGHDLPLPIANFNPDLVKFYQLGISSEIAILQFLAFYQVLEYFYVQVSDERLYHSLSSLLSDPRFRPIPRQLDRLIKQVNTHRQQTDEGGGRRLTGGQVFYNLAFVEYNNALTHIGYME